MKKFIIKKIREDCYFDSAHPCCNYFRKKVSKLCFILTVLISLNSYAQLVGGAVVKANFGVEADAYANVLEFGGLTGAAGTDDWFVNSTAFPILVPGKGVVDQSNAAAYKAQVLGDNNASFEVRQANYPITFPFPYPIVDGNLWLDTVYGRDNNSAQGNSDNSIFASTADKNSDNPSTWVLGTGSIPQKVDIIDAMAHLRGEGPRMPYDPNTGDGVDDPRPFTTLYAFAGATLRSTDGSKHIDFEFFRTKVGYVPGGSALTNTGPDGGRTAFTFNADGSVDIPGALIVSIDYENGGTRPDVRIRVWMSQSDFNSINSKGNRPFNVIPGSFVQGELSGVYGYARIEALDAANPYIWGRVNLEADTLAAPWGTLDSENAAYSDDFQAQQFVEIGINLTAFGLDKKGGTDPCANILGSLLVKTRSSAGGQQDSFTSEQKDFAGPYIFGVSTDPAVELSAGPDLSCTNTSTTITADLTGSSSTSGLTVEFYGPKLLESDPLYNPAFPNGALLPADSVEPDLTRDVTVSGVYTVIVNAVAFPGCFRLDTVTVGEIPIIPIVINCSENKDATSCASQTTINSEFATWYNGFTASGGTNLQVTKTVKDQNGNVVQIGNPIVGPNRCGGAYTVTLVATDDCGIPKECSGTFTVVGDKTAPVIADKPDVALEGCNPAWPEVVTTTYSDVCDGNGSINGVPGNDRSSADGCTQYRDYTFNKTDSCGNVATPQVVTYSRHWDKTPPVLACPSNYEWDGCEEIPILVPPVASDNCDGDIVAVGTRSDGLALNDPFPVGQIITVTYTATDRCQNSTSCDFTVYISPCTGAHCSYTQGFYGNVNGNACLPDGGFSKAQAIMANAVDATDGILGNSVGSVVFGNQSKNGNYFLLKLSDINTYNGDAKEVAKNNIFKMLPGGGTPRALIGFATYDDTSTWYPDSDPLNYAKGKRGSINNNLLSQTMTLFFNISLDNALGSVKLKTNFKTVDEIGCGTDESNPSDPGEMFSISQNVIDYWGAGATPTVDDLYELANLVLAGTVTSVSASEVNGAVDAINRGFDECRIEVSTDVVDEAVIVGASEDEPVFEPFPVPFNDVITLRYKFNYKSDVNIQMFDTKGALLMTERDNSPFFNKEITIRPRFNRGEGQMFFIKVITNRGVSIKKVISEK